MEACDYGFLSIAEMLLGNGADCSPQDKVSSGQCEFLIKILSVSLRMVGQPLSGPAMVVA